MGATGTTTLDDVVALAKSAEAAGLDSLWMANIFSFDAISTLAIIGRETSTIGLGTAVTPTYPRHPTAIAQQALTTAAASGSRFTLGIGLSHKIVIENMLGMSYDKPVRHIRDYLSILGPLSRNEPVSYRGEDYSTNLALNAKGAPPFGIVVAALGPQMLKATAELADGTLTWCTGPNTLADHTIPTINAAAAAVDRPAPRVIAALPVCVTSDAEAAKGRAAKVFEIYGSLPSYRAMLDREGAAGPEDIAITGSEAEVIDRIELHGIKTHRLAVDHSLSVESYRFSDVQWTPTPFEGRHTVTFQTETIEESRTFPAGTVVVPMDQASARVAAPAGTRH